MGCVSSNLLNREEEFAAQLGSSALGHHIVSLTSTTYGLLTLDPPQHPHSTPPHSRFTLSSLWSEPRPLRPDHQQPPEVINSWELMAGLDADSFRFSPLPTPSKPTTATNKQNSHPNLNLTAGSRSLEKPGSSALAERFERICPPNGEKRAVVYTTTLRGVRRTFEACNAVRAAFDAFGVQICERDVSMHSGFREELRELLKGKEEKVVLPPRVFVKGFYIGGAEEMLKAAEQGLLGDLLHGLPRKAVGSVCEGCGDMRFLPCFRCNGSCKILREKEEDDVVAHKLGRTALGGGVVVKCTDCNENGLVLCPLCS